MVAGRWRGIRRGRSARPAQSALPKPGPGLFAVKSRGRGRAMGRAIGLNKHIALCVRGIVPGEIGAGALLSGGHQPCARVIQLQFSTSRVDSATCLAV